MCIVDRCNINCKVQFYYIVARLGCPQFCLKEIDHLARPYKLMICHLLPAKKKGNVFIYLTSMYSYTLQAGGTVPICQAMQTFWFTLHTHTKQLFRPDKAALRTIHRARSKRPSDLSIGIIIEPACILYSGMRVA